MFGMHAPAMSEVFYEVIEKLVIGNSEVLETFNGPLMQKRAEMYSCAIKERGAPLDNCVGFIDCTRIEMARPVVVLFYKGLHILDTNGFTVSYIRLSRPRMVSCSTCMVPK